MWTIAGVVLAAVGVLVAVLAWRRPVAPLGGDDTLPSVNIESHGQQGGITAQTVNITNRESPERPAPPPPSIEVTPRPGLKVIESKMSAKEAAERRDHTLLIVNKSTEQLFQVTVEVQLPDAVVGLWVEDDSGSTVRLRKNSLEPHFSGSGAATVTTTPDEEPLSFTVGIPALQPNAPVRLLVRTTISSWTAQQAEFMAEKIAAAGIPRQWIKAAYQFERRGVRSEDGVVVPLTFDRKSHSLTAGMPQPIGRPLWHYRTAGGAALSGPGQVIWLPGSGQ